MILKLILFILVSSATAYANHESGDPLRVLFCSGFGTPSHTKPLLEYATAIRDRGHNVTFVVLKEFEKTAQPYNFNILLANPEVLVKGPELSFDRDLDKDYTAGDFQILLALYSKYYIHVYKGLKGWFEERKLENTLPQVMVADIFSSACFGLAEEYGIPLINSASSVLPFVSGFPSNINSRMQYETVWLSKFPVWQRFRKIVLDKMLKMPLIMNFQTALSNMQAEEGIPQKNPFSIMSSKIHITNTFYPFTPSTFYPSIVKMVGPVMPSIYENLTPELKKELDQLHSNQQRGMLIAFGSTAVLSQDTIHRLYEGVVKALDNGIIHRVYWGVGRSQQHLFTSLNDTRISFSSWLPQFSMLQHPAIELFITHGGAESTHESVYSGTPMIAIPVFAEQPGNAIRIKEMGIGMAFHKSTFKSNDIALAIKTILVDEEEKYRLQLDSMKKWVHMKAKRGMNSVSNTIEIVGKYGDKVLLPNINEGSWFKSNVVDIPILLGFFSFIPWILFQAIKRFFRKH